VSTRREKPTLTVVEPGPLTTLQDAGRFGLASLGIGRSGACDRASYRLANRLVGNQPGAVVLEVTFGGLEVRADADVVLALTGARCPGVPHHSVFRLSEGSTLRLPPPVSGLRTYVAVRGGIDVPEVLGSCSTDLMAGLGPKTLAAADQLSIGPAPKEFPNVDVAPVAEPTAGDVTLSVMRGPRDDWLTEQGWAALLGEWYTVTSESNRIGIRLDGTALERAKDEELKSEGMARGAMQVPPAGKPVLFLSDHPVTGGYPVPAYVLEEDLDRCAQLRPGQRVRFRLSPSAL
jgi:biotin-dependent carboxylase-like uncharacterized protein